jgi:hypothetical protein
VINEEQEKQAQQQLEDNLAQLEAKLLQGGEVLKDKEKEAAFEKRKLQK